MNRVWLIRLASYFICVFALCAIADSVHVWWFRGALFGLVVGISATEGRLNQ